MSSSHCMSQLLWFIFNKVSSQCSWPLTGQKAWNPVANLHDRSHISWILEWSQTMHFKFHVFSFVLELSGIVLFQTFIHCQEYTHCVPFLKKKKNCVLFPSVFLFLFSNYHYLGLWQLSRRKRIRFESEGIKYTQKLADGDGAKAEYCGGTCCLLWGIFSCHVLPIKVICLSVLLLILMFL